MLNHSELATFLNHELPGYLEQYYNTTLKEADRKAQTENQPSRDLLDTLADIIKKSIHSLRQITNAYVKTKPVEIDTELNALHTNFHHDYGFIHFIPESSEMQAGLSIERLEAYYTHQPITNPHNIILYQNTLYIYSPLDDVHRLDLILPPDAFSKDSDQIIYHRFIEIIGNQRPYEVVSRPKDISYDNIIELMGYLEHLFHAEYNQTNIQNGNFGLIISRQVRLLSNDVYCLNFSRKRPVLNFSLIKSIILKTLSILDNQRDKNSAQHAELLKWLVFGIILCSLIGITCYLLWPTLIFANITISVAILEIALIPLVVLAVSIWALYKEKTQITALISQLNDIPSREGPQQRMNLHLLFSTHEHRLNELLHPPSITPAPQQLLQPTAAAVNDEDEEGYDTAPDDESTAGFDY